MIIEYWDTRFFMKYSFENILILFETVKFHMNYKSKLKLGEHLS